MPVPHHSFTGKQHSCAPRVKYINSLLYIELGMHLLFLIQTMAGVTDTLQSRTYVFTIATGHTSKPLLVQELFSLF